MAKKEHPSLKGYTPLDPIPNGYKLEMVTYPNMDNFAVEWLSKIEINNNAKTKSS